MSPYKKVQYFTTININSIKKLAVMGYNHAKLLDKDRVKKLFKFVSNFQRKNNRTMYQILELSA